LRWSFAAVLLLTSDKRIIEHAKNLDAKVLEERQLDNPLAAIPRKCAISANPLDLLAGFDSPPRRESASIRRGLKLEMDIW
jgi:hypothetical protein